MQKIREIEWTVFEIQSEHTDRRTDGAIYYSLPKNFRETKNITKSVYRMDNGALFTFVGSSTQD